MIANEGPAPLHAAVLFGRSPYIPLVIYAFYGLVTYAFQMVGYLTGGVSHSGFALGVEQLSLVSLVALFAMLLVSLFARRPYALHTDRLEFLAPMPHDKRREKADSQPAAIEEEDATPCVPSGDMRDVHLANVSRGTSLGASAQASTLDATTQRYRKLAEKYGLSSRETEVAELIARGYTGPAIAEALFISENTMRTHNRRIYTKLGIHKKQELLMLIEQMGAEG